MNMKSVLFLLTVIAAASLSNESFANQQMPSGDDLMVGYYGRPGAASLGVLGQYSIEELMPKIKEKTDEYARISGKQSVTPGIPPDLWPGEQ